MLLRKEGERLRGLLAEAEGRAKRAEQLLLQQKGAAMPAPMPTAVSSDSESSDGTSLVAMLEARLKEEKRQTEMLRENKKSIALSLKMKTEELREVGQRRDAEQERWEEERTRLYEEMDRWRQRSTDEAKAKKESLKIDEKLKKLSKTASEKTKKQLDEKEAEVKKLAEEAEALRAASDKLKEMEKEHGKERKKSLLLTSRADQLGLEVERLTGVVEALGGEKTARDKMMAESAEREFRLREDVLATREIADVQEQQIIFMKGQLAEKNGKSAE